jgi:transcriptional regulator with XRE-family HTH domain
MQQQRTARHRRLIGEIAAARKAAGLSQRALAAKLRRSTSYVSKLEAGERRLSLHEFVDLCLAVGADPPALLARVLALSGHK